LHYLTFGSLALHPIRAAVVVQLRSLQISVTACSRPLTTQKRVIRVTQGTRSLAAYMLQFQLPVLKPQWDMRPLCAVQPQSLHKGGQGLLRCLATSLPVRALAQVAPAVLRNGVLGNVLDGGCLPPPVRRDRGEAAPPRASGAELCRSEQQCPLHHLLGD
jgi:hypothetical protein